MALDPYSPLAQLAGKAMAVAGIVLAIGGGLYYWRWAGVDAQVQRQNQAVDHAAADAAEGSAKAAEANSQQGDKAVGRKLDREAKNRANSARAEGQLAPLKAQPVAPELDAWIRERALSRRAAP